MSRSVSIIYLYGAESLSISTALCVCVCVCVCVLSGSDEIDSTIVSDCLKLLLVSAGSRRLSDSEFQTVGPATEKAR